MLPEAEAVARRAAEIIAGEARAAVAARGAFLLATSGGTTPWRMLRLLAELDVPWPFLQLFQVDERVAPAGDADRNLTHLEESLLARVPLPPGQFHAMPVEEADLERAAARYATTLRDIAGEPPVLDLVHLGLGDDGHTASLVPGDAALDVVDADVAVTGSYQGRRRMTLTFPLLNRARRLLWVVTGSRKREALARLCRGDHSLPAARLRANSTWLVADRAAAGSPTP